MLLILDSVRWQHVIQFGLVVKIVWVKIRMWFNVLLWTVSRAWMFLCESVIRLCILLLWPKNLAFLCLLLAAMNWSDYLDWSPWFFRYAMSSNRRASNNLGSFGCRLVLMYNRFQTPSHEDLELLVQLSPWSWASAITFSYLLT